MGNCQGYPLALSLGGVSWVEGKHPSDHLLSIYRASEGRAGGRAGPEDRANRSGRGRSERGRPSGLGQLGTGPWGCCRQVRAGKRTVPQPWGSGVFVSEPFLWV